MILNRLLSNLGKSEVIKFICIVSITISASSYAEEYVPTSPKTKYYSKDGSVLQFMKNDNCAVSCAILYRDKILLEGDKTEQGYQKSFALHNVDEQFLKENGKNAKLNGHLVLLRLIVQQSGGLRDEKKYWMIDVSEHDPQVVGPIGNGDLSREFTVLWGQKGFTIVLDESMHKWKQGDRFFVEGESIQEKDGRLTPILTIDGKRSKKKEGFPAYHYDYTTKKVTEALLMVD